MPLETSPLRDRMIFVVGARRSGTNWLQRIITTHPATFAIRTETSLFTLGIQPLFERFQHGAIESNRLAAMYVERPLLIDALRDFCDAVLLAARDAVKPGAERIVERTPDHVRVLGLIGEIYPDARIVHIIRDGRDVARSLRDQSWGPATLAEGAEEWRSAIEAARGDAPGLRHYREVRYERLIRDTGEQVLELFEWLGLPLTDELCARALDEAGTHFNIDAVDTRVTIDKWRTNLSQAERDDFERIAGDTLRELGYETAHAAAGSTAPSPRERHPKRRLSRDAVRRREARAELHETQRTTDAFLDLIGRRRFDDLKAVLTADLSVRWVGEANEWEARGNDAVERFAAELATDEALAGRQTHGHVHTGLSMSFVVLSYVTDGDVPHDRAFVLWTQHSKVRHVVYYRLPLKPRR